MKQPRRNRAWSLRRMRDLIITDLRLPGMDGIAFIKQLQAQGIQAPVIVMTAHGSVEVAVEAMKLGAADFLQKPFSLDHLSAIVQKVMAVQIVARREPASSRAVGYALSVRQRHRAKRGHARDLPYG